MTVEERLATMPDPTPVEVPKPIPHEETFRHQIHIWIRQIFDFIKWLITDFLELCVLAGIIVGGFILEKKYDICRKVQEAARQKRLARGAKLKGDDDPGDPEVDDEELILNSVELTDLR